MTLFAGLRALVLSIWAAAGVPETRDTFALSNVLATAIVEDGPNAPIWRTHVEDLAVMALAVADESGVMIHPIPRTWEGIGGMSCGPFSEPCFVTRSHTLAGQAKFWLGLMREGLAVCPRRPLPPATDSCRSAQEVASERAERARALLRLILGFGPRLGEPSALREPVDVLLLYGAR